MQSSLYIFHYKWRRRMRDKSWLSLPVLSSWFTARVQIIRNELLSVTRKLISEANDWRFAQISECSTNMTALHFTYLQLRSKNRPLCGTNCIRRKLKIILYIVGQIIARSSVTLHKSFKYITVCWRVTHMVYFSSVDGNRARYITIDRRKTNVLKRPTSDNLSTINLRRNALWITPVLYVSLWYLKAWRGKV